MASRIKIADSQLSKRSAECVRTLVVLKQQQQIIEKSLNALITNMKASSEISKDLQLDQAKLCVGRTKVCDSLKNTLYDIADELRFVKSTIQNISDIDVDKYRSKLQSLCKKMDEFNKSNVLETLVKEQNQLELDLAGFHEQLHRYDKIPSEISRQTDYRNLKSSQKRLDSFADVKSFDSLVARTGHTQRWSDEDHLLFLKLRQKCKSIPSLVHAIQSRCPDLSTETIINHESWYKTYLNLRQKQRDQIEEWRRIKQYEKNKKHLGSLSDNTEESSSDFSREQQREGSEGSFERAIRVEIMKKSHILDEIRNEEKKNQIRQWKMKKENERYEEERQIREKMRIRQQEQESQRQERILRMKIELMEYKKKKLMEAERMAEKRNQNDSRNRPKMFKTFRQQDQRFIQRRKQLIQKNNTNNKQVNNRIGRNRNRAYGNNNRQNFLRSTKGWEQKCAQLFDPTQRQAQQLTYIKDLPRLRTFYRRNMESF